MKKIIYFICLISIFSCKKEDKYTDTPSKGEITLIADNSMQSVVEALTDLYKISYPNTKINILYKPENQAISDLLHDKARVVLTSRNLNTDELAYFDQHLQMKYTPATLAIDAVTIVVAKNAKDSLLTVKQLEKYLTEGTKKIVFDNSNSSNLNYLLDKFKMKSLQNKNINSAGGTDKLIDYIVKNPDAIGIIGYNWLSERTNPKVKEMRKKIKIMSISEDGNAYFQPSKENFFHKKYPLMKYIYMLTNESYFGLGNGFIRYSCSQKGQMIVEHEGLQPYRLFDKNIIMTNNDPFASTK